MQKRKLGNSNLEVSAIGLGCMGMRFFLRPAQRQKRNDQPRCCTPRSNAASLFSTLPKSTASLPK